MFQFFSKKKFLVDFLGGFVDMHNHILPGIDDGAKTEEESIALIKGFSAIGIEKFIATPHIMHHYYPNDHDSIHNAQRKVIDAISREGIRGITLDVAAEHMIDDNFEILLEQKKVMPIKNRHLLIEMSYLQPPLNFDQAVQKIPSYHYFPILAHPERYNFLDQDSSKFMKFRKSGVLLQMNILSIGEFYGKEVQKKAYKLLDKGLIDYMASDIHNQQQLQNLREIQINDDYLKLLLPIIERTKYDFG